MRCTNPPLLISLTLYLLPYAVIASSEIVPKPPLDTYQDIMKQMMKVFMQPGGLNMSSIMQSFTGSTCIEKCAPSIGQLLDRVATTKSKDPATLASLCTELGQIDVCARSAGCQSPMHDVVMQTYKLVCVDKIQAFGDSLSCAQSVFGDLRTECEAGCISDQTKKHVDPARMPVDLESVCETSTCLLGCMQRAINTACGKADSNSLFDSILVTSSNGENGRLSSIFQGILPSHCANVKKAQADISGKFSAAAASNPSSVGKLREVQQQQSEGTASSTTLITSTMASGKPAAVDTDTRNPLAYNPIPAETPLTVNGQGRTLQCQLLDVERRPVNTPGMSKLLELLREQFREEVEPIMRADEAEAPLLSDDDLAFRRWMASMEEESYRDMGYGVPVADATNGAGGDASRLPSLGSVALALALPFVVYLFR